MVDLLADEGTTALQLPTLTVLDAARAEAEAAQRLTLESLMAAEGAPDIEAPLDEILSRPGWHQAAACRGVGVDLFVIGQGTQYEDRARRLCARCSVRQKCLETALTDGDTFGLWGGTTPTERRQMRSGRGAVA